MHSDEDLKCLPCGKVFEFEVLKMIHLTRDHPEYSEDGKMICPKCNLPKIKEEMDHHLRFDHFKVEQPKCPECGKKFKQKHQLKTHMMKHEEKNIECPECNEKFKSKSELSTHRREMHPDPQEFSCEKCGKICKGKQALKYHQICHNEKTHMCDSCGKSFKSANILKSHQNYAHSKHEILICPYEDCKKPCKGKVLLRVHIKAVHIGLKKNHPCSYCGKMFLNPTQLKKHENSIHLNVKTLKCDQCDFATNYKTALAEHKAAQHLGVMFDCDFPGCSKSYNLKGNLDAHRWRVHKIPRPNSKF